MFCSCQECLSKMHFYFCWSVLIMNEYSLQLFFTLLLDCSHLPYSTLQSTFKVKRLAYQISLLIDSKHIHSTPKVWKRSRKVDFWTILPWIRFNLWSFYTDKGQHKLRKHILLHKQFIHRKNKIFDSSKYLPLAAITALHNLGIRAVSLFKHWLDILQKSLLKDCPKMIHTGWTLLTDITVHFLLAQLGWGRVIGEAIPWQTWC